VAKKETLAGVAEAVAEYVAAQPRGGRRGTVAGSAVLTPKEERFVEAVVMGAPSQLAAATVAGYSDPNAHASRIGARPAVVAAIEDRRSAAMRDAGIVVADHFRELAFAGKDRAPEVRSSMVRANELILKAAGELDTRINVSVDARSAVLPAVDSGRAAAALEAMFVDVTVIDASAESDPT
jgi:hypothetical protein